MTKAINLYTDNPTCQYVHALDDDFLPITPVARTIRQPSATRSPVLMRLARSNSDSRIPSLSAPPYAPATAPKAIGKYPLSPTLCQLSRRRCRHHATTTPTTTTNPTNTAPRAQANTGEK